MAAERTGSITTYSNGSRTITVPADATLAVLSYGAATSVDMTAASIAGAAFTRVYTIPYNGGVNGICGVWILANPATGSQTLSISSTGFSPILHFFKGTTAIRDYAYGIGSNPYSSPQTVTTPSFDVEAGDLCCATCFGSGTSVNPAPTGSGQTEIYKTLTHGLGDKTAGSSGTTTMQGYGTYPAVVAMSLLPTDEGPPASTLIMNIKVS